MRFGYLANETRCRAGVESAKGLRPVIMGRSLKVIDEKFLVAGAEASPPWGAGGNTL
ncbi:hypothetical protein [Streptomyces sp. NPDC046862]|uniref:hypothetical protein n=1 Tax=Streptomyces sp. NPDC046862 TaxID=3154603 RepID=UPI003455891A